MPEIKRMKEKPSKVGKIRKTETKEILKDVLEYAKENFDSENQFF